MQKKIWQNQITHNKTGTDQKKNPKGLQSNIKQTDQMKGHSITT